MRTFSALLTLSEGNPPVTGHHRCQWCGALRFSLMWVWINNCAFHHNKWQFSSAILFRILISTVPTASFDVIPTYILVKSCEHSSSYSSKTSYYGDVTMGAIASQITSLMIVYSTVYSDADRRKLQSTTPLPFVEGIHRGPMNSQHKWPVTRKMFPFDDVIISCWI